MITTVEGTKQSHLMQKSHFHAAALKYADAGFPVFPCVPNSKDPAIKGGFHAATMDVETINRWWTECPQYNVAFSPHHAEMAIIDVEFNGVEQFEKLKAAENLPETFTVKSPRGGFHYYFLGELPSTVKKLAPHIDTRGVGGYVLLPPSYVKDPKKGIDGAYKVVSPDDADIAPLPPEFRKKHFREAVRVEAAPDAEIDSVSNINRAIAHIKLCVEAGDVSNEGEGGDNRLYQLCTSLRSLGVTPERSADLIEEHFNPHCNPPWEREEIEKKCQNAAEYAQNGLGAFAAPVTEVALKVALDKLPKEPEPSRGEFHSWDDDDMDVPFEEKWIIPGVLPDASTVLLYGPTQSYKSFVALDLALSVATGSKSFGAQAEKGPVFYGALEGRSALMQKRRPAWRLAHGIQGKTNFFVMKAPLMYSQDEQVAFTEEIRRRTATLGKPRLIILDTASKMMVGLDPNRDVPLLVRFCDRLVEEFGCSVIVIHHSGKEVDKGPRDSSVYLNDFDCVLQVASPARYQCEVHVFKFKDWEMPEKPFQFELKKVAKSLVLQPAQFEVKAHGPTDSFPPERIKAALERIGATNHNNAVGANVLAVELTPRLPGDTEATFKQSCMRTQRTLSRLAKEALRPFTSLNGPSRVWHLPNDRPASAH